MPTIEPWPAAFTENVSALVSTSPPVRVIAFDVSSDVETVWFDATGASFTEVTVIDTVAAALVREPSLALNVKLSVPYQFVYGVYVTFGALPDSWPFVGFVASAYVRFVVSASPPVSVMAFGVSSDVETVWFEAHGAWLTTWTDTVAAAVIVRFEAVSTTL